MKRFSRDLWAAVGFLCVAPGSVCIVLPILPTVPFYMAALLCFGKSSQRLQNWFLGTNLYKNHLQAFAEQRAMPLRTKMAILASVSLLMMVGMLCMRRIPAGQICLGVVLACHVVYLENEKASGI